MGYYVGPLVKQWSWITACMSDPGDWYKFERRGTDLVYNI